MFYERRLLKDNFRFIEQMKSKLEYGPMPYTFPTFVRCGTGSYQGLTENFFKFAEFTLTIEDAQEYVYSLSTKRRVKCWQDIEVKLYI